MWWRMRPKDYKARKGEGNRRAFRALVAAGPPPGLLAYDGGRAVGWCAVGPRASLPRFDNSRNLAPVDDQPVWSPDGNQIAFVSYLDGDAEIFVMDADGSNLTRLTNNSAVDTEPFCSPDGTKIAYTCIDQNGYSKICVMDSDGGIPTLVPTPGLPPAATSQNYPSCPCVSHASWSN